MCQTSNFGFIFNWLTTISTLFLAIAAYYNIMELRNSRKLSLRPHLIILPPISRYIFFWIPLRDLAPITRASKESENIITRLPAFRIKNIGFAVASSIEIKWVIHLPGKIADLFSFIHNSEILGKYNPHIENDLLTLTSPILNSSLGYPFSLSNSEKKNYCSANPGNDYTSELHIPFQIMHAIEYYIMGMRRPVISTSLTSLGDLPTIEVALKYNDLDGNLYAGTFTIKIHSHYIPDNVGSNENPLSSEHYSNDNVRADLRFEII